MIIRNLDRDGAILMTPHPVHGRIQQWTLTPRGATLLKSCRDRVLELEKRLVAGLDGKAEVTVRRWLAGIAAELQDEA
ncbi:DNA-binding MarR family transcriptional regulator [Bradyrhizobium sp. GM24.11]